MKTGKLTTVTEVQQKHGAFRGGKIKVPAKILHEFPKAPSTQVIEVALRAVAKRYDLTEVFVFCGREILPATKPAIEIAAFLQ